MEQATEQPRCKHCGHRFVNHGDRAIAACDGEFNSKGFGRVGHAWAICACPGWAPC